MWAWLPLFLLGTSQLIYFSSAGEMSEHELAIVHKLEETFGPDWAKKVPGIAERLKHLGKHLEAGNSLEAGKFQPWEQAEINLKWKKFLHKVGHVAEQIGKKAAGAAIGKLVGDAAAAAIG
uniref:Heteropteran venom family 16 protein 1 n=1 Tax=Ectomocoris sp. TaxID=3104572 RepID=A0AB38ZEB2_9HEMI